MLYPDESSTTEHPLTRKGQELRVWVRRLDVGVDGGHLLVFGSITDHCLVRIHSRCLYGDVLRSQDCDCGAELDRTMDMIQAEGNGVLIYLEQEGRGTGLTIKARGLHLTEELGVDTFAAYEMLGEAPDRRCYATAAESIATLGLSSVRLITNNPEKVAAVRAAGVRVTKVPVHTLPESRRAARYLRAQRRHGGHRLPLHYRSRVVVPSLATVVAVAGAVVAFAGFVLLGGFVAVAGIAIGLVGATGAA
ncbi:GTP cyclohydrolase II RibA [Nocardia crassostreae]|uniref:GTP cyclohydrolase II RibA n=1 Tax=Nocardia crassostreae TaxID=53428 RepID=UPI000836C056|nr:GTP cyclohydrolase II RibA [Nocardia crassostreae]